MMIGYIWL